MLVLALVAAVFAGGVEPSVVAPTVQSDVDCVAGAYRSDAGDSVAIMRWDPGWAYIFLDGRYGLVKSTKSPIRCAGNHVSVKSQSGEAEEWGRVSIREKVSSFRSGATTLYGVLSEPEDADGSTPLVVFVHGSGNGPTTDGTQHLQYNLPAQGISIFLFDKRGTGQSEGEFTMDFEILAEDVVAAASEARKLADGKHGALTLLGQSQGGWIAPLAAKPSRADSIVVAFGMAYGPLDEDLEEALLSIRTHGYGTDVEAAVRKIAAVTHRVMESNFTVGMADLLELQDRYRSEPWFSILGGEFTGELLRTPVSALSQMGPEKFNSLGIPWRFDPLPLLKELEVKQLWIIAAEDREAIAPPTIARLRRLQKEGSAIDVAVFPDTDHGILEYLESPDGTRKSTRHAEGYYRLVADWIKGELDPPYGKSHICQRRCQ